MALERTRGGAAGQGAAHGERPMRTITTLDGRRIRLPRPMTPGEYEALPDAEKAALEREQM